MPEAVRCPACGAAVRPGQPWCTQCWTDLRAPATPQPGPVPGPDAEPVAGPVAPPVLPGPRTEGATGGTPAPRGWPCSACGDLNDFALQACAVCGTPFLARGEDRPSLVLPVVGDVLALGRARRLALAAVAAAVLAVGVVATVALLGAVL